MNLNSEIWLWVILHYYISITHYAWYMLNVGKKILWIHKYKKLQNASHFLREIVRYFKWVVSSYLLKPAWTRQDRWCPRQHKGSAQPQNIIFFIQFLDYILAPFVPQAIAAHSTLEHKRYYYMNNYMILFFFQKPFSSLWHLILIELT